MLLPFRSTAWISHTSLPPLSHQSEHIHLGAVDAGRYNFSSRQVYAWLKIWQLCNRGEWIIVSNHYQNHNNLVK